ncbi:MAG: hypothetical protein CME31_13185 [Gimesia sp.]|nr:hypothetical protein [Gimesia sp.]
MENQEVMNETVQYQTDNAEPMVDASQIFEPEAEAEGESQEVGEVREQEGEDDQFSRKFAALSRREKDIRAKEADYEYRMRELEEKLQELQNPPEEPQAPIEERLRRNPFETLEEMGLGYDKLTELALNDGKLTPEMQMKLMREELEHGYKSKFEELEERLAQKEQEEEYNKYESIETNFKQEIDSFVNGKDEFELINANGASDLVYDVIEEHYNDTGRVLNMDEAAEAVESYLEDELEKLMSLGKVKSRFSPRQEQVFKRQPSPTLSNAHSAQAYQRADRPLSNEESVKEAAKLIRWDDEGNLI